MKRIYGWIKEHSAVIGTVIAFLALLPKTYSLGIKTVMGMVMEIQAKIFGAPGNPMDM